jgi:hypothetical protein
MTKEAKLLNRWVFDLANALIDEGWARKDAFKKAHVARNLLELMGKGWVEFSYKKSDGTTRQAVGTLSLKLIQECGLPARSKNQTGRKSREPQIGNFTYFDREAGAFRCFKAENLNTNYHKWSRIIINKKECDNQKTRHDD